MAEIWRFGPRLGSTAKDTPPEFSVPAPFETVTGVVFGVVSGVAGIVEAH